MCEEYCGHPTKNIYMAEDISDEYNSFVNDLKDVLNSTETILKAIESQDPLDLEIWDQFERDYLRKLMNNCRKYLSKHNNL